MNTGTLASRAAALAAVLGLAAGFVSWQSDSFQGPALLVLAGAMTVGGMAPQGWRWLGVLVGAGVTISQLAATGGPWAYSAQGRRSLALLGSEWVGLLAPIVVALAGAGLGASLQRLSGVREDGE